MDSSGYSDVGSSIFSDDSNVDQNYRTARESVTFNILGQFPSATDLGNRHVPRNRQNPHSALIERKMQRTRDMLAQMREHKRTAAQQAQSRISDIAAHESGTMQTP
ncbi:hypothetical protein LPJ57_009853, partial [Coemansia sp. RSA 486]